MRIIIPQKSIVSGHASEVFAGKRRPQCWQQRVSMPN
jgi:hypothetical protein